MTAKHIPNSSLYNDYTPQYQRDRKVRYINGFSSILKSWCHWV